MPQAALSFYPMKFQTEALPSAGTVIP
jgi:hypothetical protein